MFTIAKKSFTYGAHQVTLETGEIGRQAGAVIMASVDDTVVLVSVVGNKSVKPGQDFFPLTVDYIEKTYAAGRITGGFFNEVQVVAMVVSLNPEIDPDIPAMIGASAALAVSGIPFDGPIGAARVGYVDGSGASHSHVRR